MPPGLWLRSAIGLVLPPLPKAPLPKVYSLDKEQAGLGEGFFIYLKKKKKGREEWESVVNLGMISHMICRVQGKMRARGLLVQK